MFTYFTAVLFVLSISVIGLVYTRASLPNQNEIDTFSRVKRSVIYDQSNDWDNIMLKGKDLINEIQKVVNKKWKKVVDKNEQAKQVDNVIFTLRCKLNEMKDKFYNYGPVKYVRDLWGEYIYYKQYFKEQFQKQSWNN